MDIEIRRWKRTPDWFIEQEVKRVDKNFYIKWNYFIDRWEVWHKSPLGEKYQVMRVQYPDASFKPLDARTVRALEKCRWSNQNLRPQDILLDMDRAEEERLRKIDSNRSNFVEATTKEHHRTVFNKQFRTENQQADFSDYLKREAKKDTEYLGRRK